LFFADDPRRLPESWDVAVILPDILAAHRPALRVGLLDPHLGRELAAQFGVRIWPSLVFLRDGNYLGALDRMRDWDDYAVQIPDILARSASTPPLAAAASATNSNSKGTLQ